MARVEVEGIEDALLAAIPAERAEHHACTARQLSRRLGYHHSYISDVLQKMKAKGLVGFEVEIPGSIHLTGTVEGRLVTDELGDEAIVPFEIAAPPAPAKSKAEIRLGVNAERMAARMAAKKQARLDEEERHARETRVRGKAPVQAAKKPGTKKAAAPKKGTAASKATPTVAS